MKQCHVVSVGIWNSEVGAKVDDEEWRMHIISESVTRLGGRCSFKTNDVSMK